MRKIIDKTSPEELIQTSLIWFSMSFILKITDRPESAFYWLLAAILAMLLAIYLKIDHKPEVAEKVKRGWEEVESE